MTHYFILWLFLIPIAVALATRRISARNWQYWVVVLTASVMFEVGRYA